MSEPILWDVFVIDPPWPKRKGGLRNVRPNQGRDLDYYTMSISGIFNLLDREVLSKAAIQHTVFLWSVDEFLFTGEHEMENRGYRRHARLIWDKQNGIAPAFSVRFSHEYVTWFYKPKFTPVCCRGHHRTVFSEASREHSRKPNTFYRMCENWFPFSNRLDVFSREKRTGWHQFGNEVSHFEED